MSGSAITDVLKRTGVKVGEKLTSSTISKIPGKALVSINQKVGFRLFTKLGTKGVINLGKLVPLSGGVIGGAIDIGATSMIAKMHINYLLKSNFLYMKMK